MSRMFAPPGIPYHPNVGTLIAKDSGQEIELLPRHTVGRHASSHLRLSSRGISSQHAHISWLDGRWVLRDLGSRNGTTVDERPAPPGHDVVLPQGASLRFGDDPQVWTIRSLDAPEDSGTGATEAASDGPVRLVDAELGFQVSRDEEHVEVLVRSGARVRSLGARIHNHVLLLLARQRIEDCARGDLEPTEHGWVYGDDLARGLGIELSLVNIHIHRARKALEKLGILGAEQLVERRPGTTQLRLGVERLVVRRRGDDADRSGQ